MACHVVRTACATWLEVRFATGDPFRDVTSLLETATKAAVPSRHESVLALTIVGQDGEELVCGVAASV